MYAYVGVERNSFNGRGGREVCVKICYIWITLEISN